MASLSDGLSPASISQINPLISKSLLVILLIAATESREAHLHCVEDGTFLLIEMIFPEYMCELRKIQVGMVVHQSS